MSDGYRNRRTMTGLVSRERRCGVRCPSLQNVPCGPEKSMAGCVRRIRATADRGRRQYCGGQGAPAGGWCAACSNQENSGRFQLYDCALHAQAEPAVRSERFPDRSGRPDGENAEKRPEGPCPVFPAGCASVVWEELFHGLRDEKSRPRQGPSDGLRSSLVKWK